MMETTNAIVQSRPILFGCPMVRAILSGCKSQTRRIVKPQPDSILKNEPRWTIGGYRVGSYRGITDPPRMGTYNPLQCKFGQVGDHLWLRETWSHEDGCYPEATWKNTFVEGRGFTSVDYRADKSNAQLREHAELGHTWKPSIHMPRWASRITLEIISIRVEQLNDISDSDSLAEGIVDPKRESTCYAGKAVEMFRNLWESINGIGTWDENPWVWFIGFQQIV